MATATEAEASGSGGGGGSADSYIGSLISLTSKFEIRYEGVLFNINTEESSIGLKNVRSFGTEGRKKDGPQIPPSDKVYEYILFRGSDIKDLQVKASPPVQPTPPIHNDPAIIQSHYSRPTSLSTSMPSVGSGTVVDPSSHTAQPGLPRPAFQGGLPLYQPGGNLGSWGSPPVHPNANGSGLPMPMYWQGFYGPSSGLPHMQQPPLIRPPPGLPIPHSMQQQMQYPGMNVSLPSGSQNLPAEVPSLLPPVTTSSLQGLISTAPSASLPPVLAAALPYQMSSNLMPNKVSSLPPALAAALPYEMSSNLMPNKVPSLPSALAAALPYEMSSNLMPNKVPSLQPPFSTSSNQNLISTMLSPSLPPIQAAALPSDMSSNLMPNKVPVNSLPMTTSSANISLVSPLTSSLDASAAVPLISSKHMAVPASTLPYQPTLQSVSVIGGSSSSSLAETSVPLVTPDQLMQPGPTTVSLVQPLRAGKDVKVTQPASTAPSQSVPAPTRSEVQPPILPLPTLADQKMHGAAFQARHSNRGRERGKGNRISHSTTKFTEDFDFIAMNEKFKKDEVWGHLGRSNAQLRANKEVASDGDADDTLEKDDVETKKPVYVKDDFFDSLSCNALDRASRNGRTKFSEQMKIDTETFGDFPRHHGWGGRGPGRGGRSRGAYYGRGYGYGGRGRGPNMSSHTNY